MTNINILGIGGYSHDASAALFCVMENLLRQLKKNV